MNAPLRPRSGVTLVEALLFGAIGVFLLGVTWAGLRSALRGGARLEGKVQALEGSLLASARLQRDLAMLSESEGDLARVDVSIGGTTLTFPVALPGRDRSVRVTYLHDPESGRLTRQLEGEEARTLPGDFESFVARVVGAYGSEDPSVLYTLVARGELSGAVAAESGPDRSARSVLVGGAPRELLAAEKNYPNWNPIRPAPAS